MYNKSELSSEKVKQMKAYFAKRWLDPVNRIEDIFNIRRADGSLTKYKVPEPQRKMIRDGILGKSRDLVGKGVSYLGVTNKGRQLGFSVILAAEAVLIAEDYPQTAIYYVATAGDQASDWMRKLDQLIRDANHWPPELGGGDILTIKNIEKVTEKNINGTLIVGLSANPAGIRGKTGISVTFDEAAWAIRFKGQAFETWKALKYIIRQGGQARIQSTPRTSDEEEFFWGMYKKGEAGSLAIHTYYAPVITNHEDIDLQEPLWIDLNNKRRKLKNLRLLEENDAEKLIKKYKKNPMFEIVKGDHIKQKAEIPYWWVGIEDLETDRASDIEQFKQENLGIPLDETYKLLKSEWIYSNLNEGEEFEDRGSSQNKFYMTIDLAQVNDITAITITECITSDYGNVYIERRIEETQGSYTEQRDLIFRLFLSFRPAIISMDYTGHGRPVYDMLAEKLKDNGFSPNIIKKVTFTSVTKEDMAVGFKNLVMPDPITGKSRYKWLHKKRKHEEAIRHCTRVEKEILQNSIRYTGKMHGRDDHFWSKSQIALIEKPTAIPKAALGKMRKTSPVGDIFTKKSYGERFLEELNKKRMSVSESTEDIEQANKIRYERVRKIKNLNFAIKCLTYGVVTCKTKHKLVKPLHCAYPGNCNDRNCPGYRYVNEIAERYEVDKNEIWNRQREYKKEE